jgi:enoyl-CoA hydratase
MSDLTTYDLEDGIATLAMDDGKVNALSIAMLTELHAGLDRAAADEAVLVLTGREGYLSAGFDLKGFSAEPAQVVEMLQLGATLMERMLSFPRPVVVSCGGHAMAAGAFMLLSADLRIGISGPFRIGMNEVQIGLTMPTFAVELARQRLTRAAFSRSVISAHIYTPEDARPLGYLDEVVAPEQLAEATQQAARELAGLNAAAHIATKLRARADDLARIRAAIESEMTVEALTGQSTPS